MGGPGLPPLQKADRHFGPFAEAHRRLRARLCRRQPTAPSSNLLMSNLPPGTIERDLYEGLSRSLGRQGFHAKGVRNVLRFGIRSATFAESIAGARAVTRWTDEDPHALRPAAATLEENERPVHIIITVLWFRYSTESKALEDLEAALHGLEFSCPFLRPELFRFRAITASSVELPVPRATSSTASCRHFA